VARPLANPAQFPLGQISTLTGTGFKFSLGSLRGIVCGGYLSNNLANEFVYVVLTNWRNTDPFLTWNGDSGRYWDTGETKIWEKQHRVGFGLRAGQRSRVQPICDGGNERESDHHRSHRPASSSATMRRHTRSPALAD